MIKATPKSQSLLSEGRFSHEQMCRERRGMCVSRRNPFLVREGFLMGTTARGSRNSLGRGRNPFLVREGFLI